MTPKPMIQRRVRDSRKSKPQNTPISPEGPGEAGENKDTQPNACKSNDSKKDTVNITFQETEKVYFNYTRHSKPKQAPQDASAEARPTEKNQKEKYWF